MLKKNWIEFDENKNKKQNTGNKIFFNKPIIEITSLNTHMFWNFVTWQQQQKKQFPNQLKKRPRPHRQNFWINKTEKLQNLNNLDWLINQFLNRFIVFSLFYLNSSSTHIDGKFFLFVLFFFDKSINRPNNQWTNDDDD